MSNEWKYDYSEALGMEYIVFKYMNLADGRIRMYKYYNCAHEYVEYVFYTDSLTNQQRISLTEIQKFIQYQYHIYEGGKRVRKKQESEHTLFDIHRKQLHN